MIPKSRHRYQLISNKSYSHRAHENDQQFQAFGHVLGVDNALELLQEECVLDHHHLDVHTVNDEQHQCKYSPKTKTEMARHHHKSMVASFATDYPITTLSDDELYQK